MWRCLAATTHVNLKLAENTLYSTSLLDALNPNRNAYFIFKHSSLEERRIKLVLHPLSFEDLSMYKSHAKAGCEAIGGFLITRLGS